MRYVEALRGFEIWCALVGRAYIGTDEQLNEVTTAFVECLRSGGEYRGRVGDLLSAIQWDFQFALHFRRRMEALQDLEPF